MELSGLLECEPLKRDVSETLSAARAAIYRERVAYTTQQGFELTDDTRRTLQEREKPETGFERFLNEAEKKEWAQYQCNMDTMLYESRHADTLGKFTVLDGSNERLETIRSSLLCDFHEKRASETGTVQSLDTQPCRSSLVSHVKPPQRQSSFIGTTLRKHHAPKRGSSLSVLECRKNTTRNSLGLGSSNEPDIAHASAAADNEAPDSPGDRGRLKSFGGSSRLLKVSFCAPHQAGTEHRLSSSGSGMDGTCSGAARLPKLPAIAVDSARLSPNSISHMPRLQLAASSTDGDALAYSDAPTSPTKPYHRLSIAGSSGARSPMGSGNLMAPPLSPRSLLPPPPHRRSGNQGNQPNYITEVQQQVDEARATFQRLITQGNPSNGSFRNTDTGMPMAVAGASGGSGSGSGVGGPVKGVHFKFNGVGTPRTSHSGVLGLLPASSLSGGLSSPRRSNSSNLAV